MKRFFVTLAACLIVVSLSGPLQAQSSGPINRTVHVTVTDGKGAPVTDLSAADFGVKEGGKEQQVVKAAPAAARMRLALAVEERLTPDGSVRIGIFEFVKRVASVAEISLITVGLANRTVVDYTADPGLLVAAINKFTLNASRESNMSEGILEIATEFSKSKPDRPVIVVVTLLSGLPGMDSRHVLERLGQSGATMHSVTLPGGDSAAASADERGREQVLSDGPKQSGGRNLMVNATAGIPKALQQVADDLLAQYSITYTLPDGVKPNKRFSVSTKRRGVSLRAPSVSPDR
jgi:VWFA-related protein